MSEETEYEYQEVELAPSNRSSSIMVIEVSPSFDEDEPTPLTHNFIPQPTANDLSESFTRVQRTRDKPSSHVSKATLRPVDVERDSEIYEGSVH